MLSPGIAPGTTTYKIDMITVSPRELRELNLVTLAHKDFLKTITP